MRLVALMTLILILSAPAATAAGGGTDRIQWDTQTPTILFRHVSESVYFGDAPGTPRILLRADLAGRLMSFAPADTALYAVFVPDPDRLLELRDRLGELGSTHRWSDCLHGSLVEGFSFERIYLDRNGTVLIQADEARHPEGNYLAVVNGAGEILGSRPVWAAPRETGAVASNESAASR